MRYLGSSVCVCVCVCVCEDLGKGAWGGIPVFLGVKFLPVE